jgi:deoxyribonuclease-4
MVKIRLGPGGNCQTAKSGGTLGSFERISELKLNAQELEFVRKVFLTEKTAQEVGEKAKELGISLTSHAPYYINLCSEKKSTIEASKRMILETAKISEIVGCEIVAIHAAYYSGHSPEDAFKMLKEGFEDILDKMREMGIRKVKLGMETMAKDSQFGTLDEIVNLCKQVDVIPYIDWCHLFAKNNGKIDYAEIFDKLAPLRMDHTYSHFSNSKFNINTKKFLDVHVPVDNHPAFEPLAKEILKRKISIHIISESPLLEQDSLKMKKIFEKLGYIF